MFYNGAEYHLIGFEGSDLITAQEFGIEPQPITTACWRGFYLEYRIEEDKLLLDKMTVGATGASMPVINGVPPKKGDFGATVVYEGLNLPVDFTGIIRIASGFLPEYYVHMGFPKASAFETVLDLTFESGRLTGVEDLSEEMRRKRGQFEERYCKSSIPKRIKEAFSLDLKIK